MSACPYPREPLGEEHDITEDETKTENIHNKIQNYNSVFNVSFRFCWAKIIISPQKTSKTDDLDILFQCP